MEENNIRILKWRKILTMAIVGLSTLSAILFMLPLIFDGELTYGYVDFFDSLMSGAHKLCAVVNILAIGYSIVYSVVVNLMNNFNYSKTMHTLCAIGAVLNCISTFCLTYILLNICTVFTIIYTILQLIITALFIVDVVVLNNCYNQEDKKGYTVSRNLNFAVLVSAFAILSSMMFHIMRESGGKYLSFLSLFDYTVGAYQKVIILLPVVSLTYTCVLTLVLAFTRRYVNNKHIETAYGINFIFSIISAVLLYIFAGVYTHLYKDVLDVTYLWVIAVSFSIKMVLDALTYISIFKDNGESAGERDKYTKFDNNMSLISLGLTVMIIATLFISATLI